MLLVQANNYEPGTDVHALSQDLECFDNTC